MIRHCALLFICFISQLMNIAGAYNLKQIADKEYMSNSSITSLCQDEKGLMWIGTCDGLNVYDSQKIVQFTASGKEDYLSGNLIDNIIYTEDDDYWIQTYYGLNRLNRKTNGITHYNEFNKQFFMNKDNEGRLYIIKGSNCIYYFNKKENAFNKINITGIPFSDIITFFIDKNNTLWVVTKQYSRCYHIETDSETDKVSLIPTKSNWTYRAPLLYCFADDESIYYIDHSGNLFMLHIPTLKHTFIADLGSQLNSRGKVSSIIRFHDDFFVGFVMNGVIMLQKQGATKGYGIHPLSINSGVFCLKKDRFQDIVWIGTDGQGVYLYSNPLYSIKSEVLSNYTHKIERPVRALFVDNDRTLWIGTKGDGILKIYNYDSKNSIANCSSELISTTNSSLGSNAVYCFAKSRHNVLWIGDEEGLTYYSYREKRIKRLPLNVDGIDFKYIHDIYETEDSELWLASVGMGVIKARVGGSANNPVLESIQRFVINKGELSSNYFFAIYKDRSGNMLFGNRGHGVFRFNKAVNGLEPISTHKYDNVTLNNILAVNEDYNNNYLFGTTSGLIKFAPDASYRLFNSEDGFLNNTVHAILKGMRSNFWLSTNAGLVNFNTRRDISRCYGFKDGLKVLEFSDGASFRDEATGTLLFGGINGFVSINADGKRAQLYMPPIYFDKLSIFGQQYSIGEFMTKKRDREILKLDYDQNFFTVSFASVDYLNGNNNVYYYKLKGLSNQWVNNGSQSEVAFTNMAPGEYTLLVKYYNSVFDKESREYSLLIKINSPWYATGFAYFIYSLLLIAFILWIIRYYRLRSQRKKIELLNEIEKRHQRNVFESKLRFFTNIAHEFCTPLTLIYGPCGRILSSKGLNKMVVDYVKMIQTNAERLNNLIHELIEFRRIETDNRDVHIETLDLSSLMNEVNKTFVEVAKSGNITFLSKIPEHVKWNSDKGFIYTIIINLISNAFKNTSPGKQIKIELDNSEANQLVLRVANERSITNEQDFEQIFNKYAILDNFEKQDERSLYRSGLGLAISYNMANLLGGTLKAENTSDRWVLFTLTLPHIESFNKQLDTKRAITEYLPTVDVSSVLKLPTYEFDKSRPTLLIIDDEIEMLWFIGEIFSDSFNIIPLQKSSQIDQVLNELYPDVIICDAMTEDVNGIELTKRIKSAKETAHIPVVILSGNHEEVQRIAALSSGAEMYITKPFNAEFLRVSVCGMIERKEMLKDYFSSPISSFEKMDGKLTHKESKKFRQSVLKIINDNITNKDLTPQLIADKLSISIRSLYRKMDEMSEDSPNALIKKCRLYVAKDLLLKTQKNIEEIAFDAGFSNKVTFFKAFKEMYNCTPKEFRTEHLKEME